MRGTICVCVSVSDIWIGRLVDVIYVSGLSEHVGT